MRRYLLDTHILLWALEGLERVPPKYRDTVLDGRRCWVSVASIWEIGIKEGMGKLKAPPDMLGMMDVARMGILSISPAHARRVRDLPPIHSDPFDRMIVVQAQMEGLTLVTADRQVARYDVDLIH